MESNTTKRIHQDLIESDTKGLQEYGVTVDRKDYSQKQWLQHAYEEILDTAKYLKRAIDTEAPVLTQNNTSSAVDILLEIDASLQTEIGTETTPQERAAFKLVSKLILQRCARLQPERFAIPSQPQV